MAGVPILIHQKATARNIHDVWMEFRKHHKTVRFTAISISEVKRNERSEGIS